jgi:hypothetical protein
MDSKGNHTDRRNRALRVGDPVRVTDDSYPQGTGKIVSLPNEGTDWHGFPMVQMDDTRKQHRIPDSALERTDPEPGSTAAHLETLIETTKNRNDTMRAFLDNGTVQAQTPDVTTEQQIRNHAAAISIQLRAIADGTVIGSRAARLAQIAESVETLRAWVGDDRPHTAKTSAVSPRRADQCQKCGCRLSVDHAKDGSCLFGPRPGFPSVAEADDRG